MSTNLDNLTDIMQIDTNTADIAAIATGIDWKEAVATFADLATTYTTPVEGWTASVNDEDTIYRYDGASWVALANGTVPLATSVLDGKISSDNFNDVNSLNHSNILLKTGIYTAVSKDVIMVDTTASAFTITLPITPTAGDYVKFIDNGGNLSTNALTIARNGSNIQSLAEDMTVNTDYTGFSLVYFDVTRGWVIV